MSRGVTNCSPWLREQAGHFYDAGIKKLVPRFTKCIAIHGDYVEEQIKVCCKSATSESLQKKMLYKYFLDFVSLLSGYSSYYSNSPPVRVKLPLGLIN
jgi:hypothetical protein